MSSLSLSTYTTTTSPVQQQLTYNDLEYAMQKVQSQLAKEMYYMQKQYHYYTVPTPVEWRDYYMDETKSTKGKDMSIVTKLKNINLDEGDKLLRKHGIVDDSGDLTTNGKAVLMNMLLDSMKEKLVENLKTLDVSDKSKKKAE